MFQCITRYYTSHLLTPFKLSFKLNFVVDSTFFIKASVQPNWPFLLLNRLDQMKSTNSTNCMAPNYLTSTFVLISYCLIQYIHIQGHLKISLPPYLKRRELIQPNVRLLVLYCSGLLRVKACMVQHLTSRRLHFDPLRDTKTEHSLNTAGHYEPAT